MRKHYVLSALDMNVRMAKNLRADLRVASELGDRPGVREIHRHFLDVMKNTMDLLRYEPAPNPPEPLIEYEKLRKAYQLYREVQGALLTDQPDFTDAQYEVMLKKARQDTSIMRSRARRFLKYFKKRFPDLLTGEREEILRKMSGLR